MKKQLLLCVIVAILFMGCGSGGDSDEGKTTRVQYKVTGSASSVDLTFENVNGGISQYSDISLPWAYNFEITKGHNTFLYISAQNNGETGTVIAEIYLDGNLVKTSTSSGAYVIATASTSF
jgi:hypothetical protein